MIAVAATWSSTWLFCVEKVIMCCQGKESSFSAKVLVMPENVLSPEGGTRTLISHRPKAVHAPEPAKVGRRSRSAAEPRQPMQAGSCVACPSSCRSKTQNGHPAIGEVVTREAAYLRSPKAAVWFHRGVHWLARLRP